MSGWNSFSNDWSRMQLRMNHALWESGIGRGRPAAVNTLASVTKKKLKKLKNGIPEDGHQNDSEVWNSAAGEWMSEENHSESRLEDMTEMETDNQYQADNGSDIQDGKKHRLEQQVAAIKTQSSWKEGIGEGYQVEDPAFLQRAIVWAEILGDPVSVRRRKKRVNQFYGNQGNANRG